MPASGKSLASPPAVTPEEAKNELGRRGGARELLRPSTLAGNSIDALKLTGLTDIQALTLLQEAPSTFRPAARPDSLRCRCIAIFTELALTGAGQSSVRETATIRQRRASGGQRTVRRST